MKYLKHEINADQKKLVSEYVKAKLEAERLQQRISELYAQLSLEFKNKFQTSAVLTYKGKPLLIVQKSKIAKLIVPEEVRSQYLVYEDAEKFVIPRKE